MSNGFNFVEACHCRSPSELGLVSGQPNATDQLYRPPAVYDPKAPTAFIILARPRTGSNLLVGLLDQHRHVQCSYEALHLEETFAWPPLNWTVQARDADRYRFLDLMFTAPPNPLETNPKRILAVGFKAFTKQFFLPELLGISSTPSIRKVVLRRRNLVDMYLSEKKASATGAYARSDTSQVVLTINPVAMVWYFEAIESDYACIDAARHQSTARYKGADWHSVDYDELTNHQTRQGALQGVLNHILPPSHHISMRSIGPGLHKQDHSLRNESIANFGEVYEALKKTPRYLNMLMEGL
jgi:hypothetical protein